MEEGRLAGEGSIPRDRASASASVESSQDVVW